jgi:hypothetical protein
VPVANVARDRLVALVAAQDESSSSVQLAAKPPGALRLHVEGVGDIELPVTEGQSARLLALGRRAPFGRGEETLTDTSVRDTWEIPRELVRVEWDGSGLDHDMQAVREELGLPDHCRLTARLHSMLVYDTGQFFLPHQDSEKDDAMVATLVVTLPSEHTGGELVVHHLGEATAYRGLPDRVSLVAFYADCRHEVRPVTSGRRITLTYNLLLHGDPVGRVPDEVTIAEVAAALREHFSSPVRRPYRDVAGDPPARLVFLLDHEYTARGLGWSRLKGDDAGRATLLRAAADAAGCTAVLGLTEIQETWEAAEPDHGYRTHRRYRDGAAVEDDGDGQDGDDGYEVDELLDSSTRLTLWTDDVGADGAEISLGVDAAEVCAATPSSDLRPFESQYEGYMGNYGNTVDRWYRRAAVVLWPRERDFANRGGVAVLGHGGTRPSGPCRRSGRGPRRRPHLGTLLGRRRPGRRQAGGPADRGVAGRSGRRRPAYRPDAAAPLPDRDAAQLPRRAPRGAGGPLRRAVGGGRRAAPLVRRPEAGVDARPGPHPSAVADLAALPVRGPPEPRWRG